MKHWKVTASVLLCLAILLTGCVGQTQTSLANRTARGLSGLGTRAGTLLSNENTFPAGTSVCDWCAMALALAGGEEDFEGYLENLRAYVEQAYAREGGLDRVKATPYHRIALTVLALGGDPTAFGTAPDGTAIDLIADGTYAFGGESIGAQGLNGWIYALLTLDASGVTEPENCRFSREEMCEAIVAAQELDGGFGLVPGKADVDITAMAIQALAPYQKTWQAVIDSALAYLSDVMLDTCTFETYGVQSVESSAQVVLALCALGIDPETDSRFCRDGQTLLTGIDLFRQPDDTYGHALQDEEGNYLATAQTLLAQTALEKLRNGDGWIFDFQGMRRPGRNERTACRIGWRQAQQ